MQKLGFSLYIRSGINVTGIGSTCCWSTDWIKEYPWWTVSNLTAVEPSMHDNPVHSYALMFSALYQYHRIIPVTYRFRVFGIVMSNKLFLYVLALQVAFSQSFATLTPAVCGILSGALYRTDIGNIKQWRFPAWVQKLTVRFVKPYLASPPIARSAATTPSQRPIVTGIPPMENIMTAGLRNRRGTTATSASTRSDTASVSAAATEGTSSVRVSSGLHTIACLVVKVLSH